MTAAFPDRIVCMALAMSLVSLACTRPSGDENKGVAAGSRADGTALKPSVLLISMDTTRADRLGCYGSRAGATPNLDRWAAEGVVFENTLTPVPVTLPAHTSLMTGLLPQRHGVRNNGTYRVAGRPADPRGDCSPAPVTTRPPSWGRRSSTGEYGLERGASSTTTTQSGAGAWPSPSAAPSSVTDAALATARSLHPPFFLFVHYFDPHAAYKPARPLCRPLPRRPLRGGDRRTSTSRSDGCREPSRSQAGSIRNDRGRRVDHGESLGEHGEPTHGVFLYQATLHVPMLVVAPGAWPAGKRVASLASLTDVAPTLLELSGQTAPPASTAAPSLPPSAIAPFPSAGFPSSRSSATTPTGGHPSSASPTAREMDRCSGAGAVRPGPRPAERRNLVGRPAERPAQRLAAAGRGRRAATGGAGP